MTDRILPLFQDDCESIEWKSDRITAGQWSDIVAISTRGGKFILFKILEEGDQK